MKILEYVKVLSDNTHHRWKDCYKVGIQVNCIGFDQTRKYVIICVY